MNRHFILGLTLFAGAFAAASASAQQACSTEAGCSQSFHYDYYRNNRWPLPFRGIDSSAVLNYFDVQRNNGWKLHNTLGNAMFEPQSHMLTDAGRTHMQWIVSQAPQDRRVVFVLVGRNQQETAARVESTQLAISEMIPVGPLPTIYLTDRDAPGSSGTYQTAINRAMNSTVPSPRLTAAPATP
ncbi:MAG: hypothetical protein R3C53_04635 [Pirellulaceae bacterium]